MPLVRHIIQETKFNFNQEAGRNSPFAVFVRVVDQIITNYLRRDYPEFIEGLNIEFNEEGKEFLDEDIIINFARARFPQLISDNLEKKELASQLMEIIKPYIPKNNKISSLV